MVAIPNIPVALPGNKITAAYWNATVRDGVGYLMDAKPLAMVTQGTAQSIPTGVFTAVNFDTEVLDRDAQHDLATAVERVTIGKTLGWYKISGVVTWAANSAGTRRAAIYLNGAQVQGSYVISTPGTSLVSTSIPPVLVYGGASGDYVTLGAFQDTGAALSLSVSSGFRSSMTVEWVGR